MKQRSRAVLILMDILFLFLLPCRTALAGQDAASQMKEALDALDVQELEEQTGAGEAVNTMVKVTQRTDIKEGPDMDSATLGMLDLGELIMAIGRTGDGVWYEVYYEGRNAYILSNMAEETGLGENPADTRQEEKPSVMNWILILAGVFAGVFCVSFTVIWFMDRRNKSGDKQPRNMETIDLEANDK